MSSALKIPAAAATAIRGMLDNCAQIEAGQHVMVVAARDGLYGGFNIVDEGVIDWLQMGLAEYRPGLQPELWQS